MRDDPDDHADTPDWHPDHPAEVERDHDHDPHGDPEDAGEDQRGAEDAPKSYGAILEEEIWNGLNELKRPALGLFMSGLSAGLDIGFSLLLMATMLHMLGGDLSAPLAHFAVANMYAVGFIFVILGRSELFTEHTTLAVFPVLSGRATLARLGRLWGLIYVSNLVGASAFAYMAAKVGPRLGIYEGADLGTIAEHLVQHPTGIIFASAVLAGWLMGLLSWLVTAAQETISRIFFVWLVATAIGLAGLHHSIVGTVEVLAGVFAGHGATMTDFGRFLFWTTLGNAAGGVIFVAIIKYSHAVAGPWLPPRVMGGDGNGGGS